ncbi:MAG: hypothetical protein V1924_05025 [Candidatus Bathyarchaeota archaeon]
MSHKGVLFLGFLVLAGLVVYAATRKPRVPSPSTLAGVAWTRVESPQPTGAAGPSPSTVLKNKAEWDITYNAEGLPTKIVIHREIKQY